MPRVHAVPLIASLLKYIFSVCVDLLLTNGFFTGKRTKLKVICQAINTKHVIYPFIYTFGSQDTNCVMIYGSNE